MIMRKKDNKINETAENITETAKVLGENLTEKVSEVTQAMGVTAEESIDNNQVATTTSTQVATNVSKPNYGFENEEENDVIIPRVKIIQVLSPEVKDKLENESGPITDGCVINSLTKVDLKDDVFIPVFMYKSNICWNDRTDGGGIFCIARDGKTGMELTSGNVIVCQACGKNEFDNSKEKKKDKIPTCCKYINFFGFMESDMSPIILSFSKTSLSEGKRMYSLCKMACITGNNPMWSCSYKINTKLMSKDGNSWWVPVVSPAGPTNKTILDYGMSLYKAFSKTTIESDLYTEEPENDIGKQDSSEY